MTTKLNKILKFTIPITKSEDLDEGFHQSSQRNTNLLLIGKNQQITEELVSVSARKTLHDH